MFSCICIDVYYKSRWLYETRFGNSIIKVEGKKRSLFSYLLSIYLFIFFSNENYVWLLVLWYHILVPFMLCNCLISDFFCYQLPVSNFLSAWLRTMCCSTHVTIWSLSWIIYQPSWNSYPTTDLKDLRIKYGLNVGFYTSLSCSHLNVRQTVWPTSQNLGAIWLIIVIEMGKIKHHCHRIKTTRQKRCQLVLML